MLIFSSLTMALSVEASQKGKPRRAARYLGLTLLCGFVFLGVKAKEYYDKFTHHTLVAADSSGAIAVYDGHVHEFADLTLITGYRLPLANLRNQRSFDIHLVSEADLKEQTGGGAPTEFSVRTADVKTDLTYGPWKNLFFACYFTLTGVHGVHVIGGMIPLALLLIQAMRGKVLPHHTEYVGLYWHFVDLVWIFLFPLLYLI